MALTVGGKKYSGNDRRVASYKRINRSRGIQERNLGKRSGGGTPQEAAERVYSPPTTLQEANAQAAYSQETGPEPIASAAEGGVIFSDNFRGTPVASAAGGGVLYQQNQAQESGYIPSSFTSRNTVSPAPTRKGFLENVERKSDELKYSSEQAPQGSSKQFLYSTAAFGTNLVSTGGRTIQSVLGIFKPTRENTLIQAGGSLKSGYNELRQTGGLPSAGNYLRNNPSAPADIAFFAATARLPIPRGLQKYYPKVGVVGETLPEVEVSTVNRATRRVATKPSPFVEETAATALRTGSRLETEAFIRRLSKDVNRRVDVTSPSRFDNILPSPSKENLIFKTTRSVGGKVDSVTGRKTRGLYVEATQTVPKEFVFSDKEPKGTFVVDTQRNELFPQSVLTRQQTKQRVVDVRFRKSVAVPSQPQALGDFVRLEERPQYVDLNKALNKRYELYVDSSGVERIRLTQEAKANTAVARKKTFEERMKDILPGNKKGQAQLFSPETVYKDNPSDVLRKRYGQPKPRGRARVSLEEEPPRSSRQATTPSFIEDVSGERKFFGGKLLPALIVNSRSTSLPALYGQSRKQEFRVYQGTSADVNKMTGPSTGKTQFSFRSLASGVAVGAAVSSLALPKPPSAITRGGAGKPPKNSIGRYFGFPESGGGGSSSRSSRGGGSQKTKYSPSLSGVNDYLLTGKTVKGRYSGRTRFGGLERRGVTTATVRKMLGKRLL